MSNVGLNRASLFGIVRETELGKYKEPTLGSQIVALRPGNTTNYEPEKLENDELLNDIGAAKAAIGKESVSGEHPAYLRHSGVEGQEPQLGIIYESIMGAKFIAVVESVTIAGSTTSILKLGAGLAANCREGQALLIKDGLNGYHIRNIRKIQGDDLILNFKLPVAPAAGINLGKAIVYIPAAQGHPTFATTKYHGNGFAKECTAGNTTTQLGLTAAANGYGELTFSYEGTTYLYNPIEVLATNKFIDFVDQDGTHVAYVPELIYKTPIELAEALEAALNSVSAHAFTVKYNNTTGKYEFKTESTTFSILWDSGINAANSIASLIGFDNSADDTGATEYISDNALNFAISITPDFDKGDIIVMKNVDLYIGDTDDNVCICAQEVGLTIAKEAEDVDCMCEPSGVSEKVAVGRTVEMTVTASVKKYDASLLDALLKNKTVQAMMNSGKKNGINWVPGQNFNIYLQSATVSSYNTTGDSFIQMELTLSGFVSSDTKDVFLNFV